MTEDKPERIQKVLAAAGIASRRKLEAWIRAGRVSVNGETAGIGQKISRSDRIAIDGKPVVLTSARRGRVLMYHKPVGELCTRDDPGGRPTIFDKLPAPAAGRWISVGRLDINSVGLILLTTDGQLANALMHPSSGITREYHVRVLGEVSDEKLARLRKGVQLEDGPARFTHVEPRGKPGQANRWFACRLVEGRNREVRRLWEAVGCKVNRLLRTRYGPLRLPRELPPGQSVELDSRSLAALYRCVGLAVPEA